MQLNFINQSHIITVISQISWMWTISVPLKKKKNCFYKKKAKRSKLTYSLFMKVLAINKIILKVKTKDLLKISRPRECRGVVVGGDDGIPPHQSCNIWFNVPLKQYSTRILSKSLALVFGLVWYKARHLQILHLLLICINSHFKCPVLIEEREWEKKYLILVGSHFINGWILFDYYYFFFFMRKWNSLLQKVFFLFLFLFFCLICSMYCLFHKDLL